MENHFKQMTDFFHKVGAVDIEHSEKSYMAHGIGVYNDLKAWGCDEEVCDAGLFHSIYGTELFQKFAFPLDRRNEVRELIGERAERLAYLNCVMDRTVFDNTVANPEGPHHFRDRCTSEDFDMADDDFRDLCTIHVCDWLEQIERSQNWDYRRQGYNDAAKWLGGIAWKNYERVFANEATT